jgi:hypothetical protein
MMPYQLPPGGIPEGGARGTSFDDFAWLRGPDDAYVYSLQVNHGDTLDHLVVTYLQGGRPRVKQHGASNGGNIVYDPWVIKLDSGERLIKVECWFHAYSGGTIELNGLRFTKRVLFADGGWGAQPSPLFGSTDTTGWGSVTLQVPGGAQMQRAVARHPDDSLQPEICAFWGREGDFVDALGIWVRPCARSAIRPLSDAKRA